jgi:hypothetical protein
MNRPGRQRACQQLRRLGLTASMVTTLLLFAAADVALPSVHTVLFLGPLAPLSFAVALQWDDRAGVVATRIRNTAALLMVAAPILAFGSVAREPTVPSIIWFICGVSAVASLLAVMSTVGVDSNRERNGEGRWTTIGSRKGRRDNNKMQQSKLGQAMELRC